MFKVVIAGVAALGLAVAATPNTAKANDAIIGGALIGAILGGAVGAAVESNHRRDHYQPRPPRRHGYRAPRHSRGHYGHGYRKPVVVERRVYRRPPPRNVYRDHHRPRHYGRGHGRHHR